MRNRLWASSLAQRRPRTGLDGSGGGRQHLVAQARVSEARDGNIVRAEPPSVLPPNFTIASLVDSRAHFTMTPDAQRFLIRQSDGDPRPAVQVILNWKDALTENID